MILILLLCALPVYGHSAEQLLVDNPYDTQLLRRAAQERYDATDYQQALAYTQQVTEVAQPTLQESIDIAINQGAAQAQLRDFKSALASYEKVLSLDPRNQKAQKNIPILKELLKEQQQKDNQQQDKNDKSKDRNKDSSKRGSGKDQQDQENADNNKSSDSSQSQSRNDGKSSQQSKDKSAQQQDNKSGSDKQQSDQSQSKQPNKPPKPEGDLNDSKSDKQPGQKQQQPACPQVSEQELKEAQEYIKERQEQAAQQRQQAKQDVGEQLAYWLEQVDEHERQGQQKLLAAQAYQQREEHGAKNW